MLPIREIPLRASLLMDAPEGAVRRALGRADVWTRTARALGARAELAGGGAYPRAPLRAGELMRVRRDRNTTGTVLSPLWPTRSLILRVDIDPDQDAVPLPSLELVAGPLDQCRVTLTTSATLAGTLVTVDCRVRAEPAVFTPRLRRRVLAFAQMLLGIAVLVARETRVVVAGAVIENGAVLAARRTGPAALAGCWELPGGKVNPGETEKAALARELVEELGLTVTVTERIGADIDLGDNTVLRCYAAEIIEGRPRPTEHDAVRWIEPSALHTVNWLEPDRAILPELHVLLSRIGTRG